MCCVFRPQGCLAPPGGEEGNGLGPGFLMLPDLFLALEEGQNGEQKCLLFQQHSEAHLALCPYNCNYNICGSGDNYDSSLNLIWVPDVTRSTFFNLQMHLPIKP